MSDREWPRIKLGDITNKVGSGATPKGGEKVYKAFGTPLIRSMNVVNFGFKRDGLVFLDKVQADALKGVEVQAGDVLLNITGASIGRVTTAPSDMAGARVNQHVCIIRPKETLLPKFLSAYLSSPEMQSFVNDENYGVTRQALTKQQILDIEVPVPPLAEQKRIVDKLDRLLVAVDICKARLDAIPAILKRFRQSVLAAATSGVLTEEWREKRSEESAWKQTTLNDLVVRDGIFDGPFGSHLKSDDYVPEGVRVIRLENIGPLTFHDDKRTYISAAKYESLKRHTLEIGDIVFSSFIDEEVRVCRIPNIGGPSINKADCFCIRIDTGRVNARFVELSLANPQTYLTLREQVHGATRPRINLKQLKSYEIDIPVLAEQCEVVRRVDQLLMEAAELEARVKAARAKVEQLAAVCLGKAFEGKFLVYEAKNGVSRAPIQISTQARYKPQRRRA